MEEPNVYTLKKSETDSDMVEIISHGKNNTVILWAVVHIDFIPQMDLDLFNQEGSLEIQIITS